MKDNPEKPTDRTNLFLGDDLDRSSPVACCLSWMAESGFDDDALADQFKRAADLAIDALLQGGDGAYADGLFPPIVYLYRHALELKLKSLIRLAYRMHLIKLSRREKRALARSHSLLELKDMARKSLAVRWPDFEEEGESADLFEWIDALADLDDSGQTLRYSEGPKGRSVEKFPPAVDLKRIRNGFVAAYDLLDGAILGLHEGSQMMGDASAEMG